MSPQGEIVRKLAAIMFTDIAGYTALSAKDENKALKLLDVQKQTLTPIIDKFNGTLHKEIGDGLLFTFLTVTEAVKCGIEIQKETKFIDELNLRIGIHEGEITLKDGDALGDDVNVASRIEPFSAIGGIAVSGKVQQNLSSLPEYELFYIGEPKLKGVSQDVKVYCITSHDLPKTETSKVSAKLEKEKSNFNLFTITGGLLTTIGVAFWLYISIFDTSFAGEAEVPSVAIFPLDNKGAEEDDFYAYGISADLISDVASAGLIRVASLNKIEDLGEISTDEKANKLDVRFIAEGSLWRRDSIFQLSMELYDTQTEKVIWSQRWQKKWTAISGIRSELAENILKNLNVEQRNEGSSYVANPESYEYYLKAKHKFEKSDNSENLEIAIGLLDKAIELDNNLTEARILLGSIYSYNKDFNMAMDVYNLALKQSEILVDKLWMGRSIRKIGTIFYFQNEKVKALDYTEKSLKIAEELNDKLGIANCLNNIGVMVGDNNNYEKALEYKKRSFLLFEELGDKREMGRILLTIGRTYSQKGDFEQALEYTEKSLSKFKESEYALGIANSLSNIGKIYKGFGDFNQLIKYLKELLIIQEEQGHKEFVVNIYGQLGWAFFTKGIYDKSIEYYIKALSIIEELNNKNEVARFFINIGFCHFYNESYVNALEYFEKSSRLQLEPSGEENSVVKIFIPLTKKLLGQEYDTSNILIIVKDEDKIRNYYADLFGLFQLLEDKTYLEKAYNDVKGKAEMMKDEFKEKYFNFPLQKQIIQEWQKVNA